MNRSKRRRKSYFLFRFVVGFLRLYFQLLQKCFQTVFTFRNDDCLSQKINPLLKLAIYLPRGFPAFHHLRIFGDRQQFFQPASGTVDTRDYCFRFFLHQNSPADVVSIPYGDYFPQKVNGWQQEKKRSRIITCRMLRASGPRIRL